MIVARVVHYTGYVQQCETTEEPFMGIKEEQTLKIIHANAYIAADF